MGDPQVCFPGDVCVDVGANVGAVALFLAKSVGASGKVHCFEPGPVFFSRLKQNIELNQSITSVVELHNLGVSEKSGELHWVEDPEFPGNAFMFGDRGVKIEVVTLDAYLGPRLKRLDFLKLDVEGMEIEVLRGAQEILGKFRPKVFMESLMDFEGYRKSPVRKAAADLLLGLGYKLFQVTDTGALKPVEYPNFSHNTLGVP